METIKKNTWEGRGKFSPIGSTFKAEFYCVSGKTFPGYSKGSQAQESQDKILLLCKWIGRLSISEKGYFKPENIDRIEFYLNGIDKGELIFTLYPDGFKMALNQKYSCNERLINFLKNFYYDLSRKKLDAKKILPKKVILTEDQRFHTVYKYLKNESEVMDHVIEGKKDGYEPGFLLGWAQKYREKYF